MIQDRVLFSRDNIKQETKYLFKKILFSNFFFGGGGGGGGGYRIFFQLGMLSARIKEK